MTPDLFYVLDLGDALARPLERVLQPMIASAVGHLISFAVNGTLWLGFIAIAARVVS